MKTIKKENGDTNLVEEKTYILKKALETIDLGIGEAQVETSYICIYYHFKFLVHKKLSAALGRFCAKDIVGKLLVLDFLA